MGDDLAVARRQKGVTVAAQLDAGDDGDHVFERDVAADDAGDAMRFEGAGEGDAEFLGAGEDVGFGGDGDAFFDCQLVPGARGRVVALGRFLVGEVVEHALVGVAGEGLLETTGVLAGVEEGARIGGTVVEAGRCGAHRIAPLFGPARDGLAVAADGRFDLVGDPGDDFFTHLLVGEAGERGDDHAEQNDDEGEQALLE